MVANIMSVSALITLVMAGAAPLYGTCRIFVPVMCANKIPDRCVDAPLPVEANDSCFFFANATNAETESAATDGCSTRIFGIVAINVIGAKSFTASYESLGYKLGLVTCEVNAISRL